MSSIIVLDSSDEDEAPKKKAAKVLARTNCPATITLVQKPARSGVTTSTVGQTNITRFNDTQPNANNNNSNIKIGGSTIKKGGLSSSGNNKNIANINNNYSSNSNITNKNPGSIKNSSIGNYNNNNNIYPKNTVISNALLSPTAKTTISKPKSVALPIINSAFTLNTGGERHTPTPPKGLATITPVGGAAKPRKRKTPTPPTKQSTSIGSSNMLSTMPLMPMIQSVHSMAPGATPPLQLLATPPMCYNETPTMAIDPLLMHNFNTHINSSSTNKNSDNYKIQLPLKRPNIATTHARSSPTATSTRMAPVMTATRPLPMTTATRPTIVSTISAPAPVAALSPAVAKALAVTRTPTTAAVKAPTTAKTAAAVKAPIAVKVPVATKTPVAVKVPAVATASALRNIKRIKPTTLLRQNDEAWLQRQQQSQTLSTVTTSSLLSSSLPYSPATTSLISSSLPYSPAPPATPQRVTVDNLRELYAARSASLAASPSPVSPIYPHYAVRSPAATAASPAPPSPAPPTPALSPSLQRAVPQLPRPVIKATTPKSSAATTATKLLPAIKTSTATKTSTSTKSPTATSAPKLPIAVTVVDTSRARSQTPKALMTPPPSTLTQMQSERSAPVFDLTVSPEKRQSAAKSKNAATPPPTISTPMTPSTTTSVSTPTTPSSACHVSSDTSGTPDAALLQRQREQQPLVPDYEEMIRLCRIADPSDDMEKLIKSKLLKYYYSVHPDFVRSRGFRKQLRCANARISEQPELVFYHLKEIVDELKVRRSKRIDAVDDSATTNVEINVSSKTSASSASTVAPVASIAGSEAAPLPESTGNKRTDELIKKLNKALYIITKRIEQLEESEVDWDDEDSSYLQVERFKKRACQIYEKICDLTGESKNAYRQVRKPLQFKGTTYHQFNRTLQAYVNHTKEFPDYFDVLRMLEHCNTTYTMGLAQFEMKHIAQDAFIKVGKILQDRRKHDLYETVTHYGGNCEDPATTDPTLMAKLSENQKHKKKISDILAKYAREQDMTAEEQKAARLKKAEAEKAALAADGSKISDGDEDTQSTEGAGAKLKHAKGNKSTELNSVQQKETEEMDDEDEDDDEEEEDEDEDDEEDEPTIEDVCETFANGDISDGESDVEFVNEENDAVSNNVTDIETIVPDMEPLTKTNKVPSPVMLHSSSSFNNNINAREKTAGDSHNTSLKPTTKPFNHLPNGRLETTAITTTNTIAESVATATTSPLKIVSVSRLNEGLTMPKLVNIAKPQTKPRPMDEIVISDEES